MKMEKVKPNKILLIPIKVIIYPIAFVVISFYELLKWMLSSLDRLIETLAKWMERVFEKVFLMMQKFFSFLHWVFSKIFHFFYRVLWRLWQVLRYLFNPFYRILSYLSRHLLIVLRWMYAKLRILDRLLRDALHKLFYPVYVFFKKVLLKVKEILVNLWDFSLLILKTIMRPFFRACIVVSKRVLSFIKFIGRFVGKSFGYLYSRFLQYPVHFILSITRKVYLIVERIGKQAISMVRTISNLFYRKQKSDD